ncbi:MobA/MobL family protein, partial [Escherichia coli]|nr:MobA/MobL family protein [Escherichia coli]
MAIYHLSMKIISRNSGYSAVASAAYRSGSLMLDERTGLTHDYTRKSGVAEAVILTPATAPVWCTNRAELWNAVEKAERRKNSQLAREIELAIPRELPQDAARETVLAFVRENFVSQGMIADVAFHHMDKTNPHAHIMLTTRAVGPAGFGGKVRDWNDRTHAETWRASWADHANRALVNAGYQEEIDHRSYERQGLEKTPGIHLGKSACAMETRGIETERGEQNRLINRLNLEIQISRTEL